MPKIVPVYSLSSNNIPFVKWGFGPKTMLIFSGGPGNFLPKGLGFRAMTSEFDPFVRTHTLYMIGRKRDLKDGATTRGLSDDFAEMVKNDLGGQADTVIGTSFGGMIAQHLAADHADRFRHIVIAIASHKMSDLGKKIDLDFAHLIARGKYRKAALRVTDAVSDKGIARFFTKALFWLFGSSMMKGDYPGYSRDIVIEAEAETSHNADEALARIAVPVLIIGGTNDVYFPLETYREMHAKIKNSVLKIYEGKNHMSTMSDKRFASDVREFIG
ncbi:MAG: hypothetical protein A2Y33_14935 [Spirochaetes bacterium GWF1_51_8]|nr:MAG: hypothetical protein A2Y33_14935 [Spirochaetes bacterium GWF1_51_8]